MLTPASVATWLVGQPANILFVAACHFALWIFVNLTAFRADRRSNLLWVPAVLWLVYAAWEGLVLLKTPEANIRVDLLVIWPLIALATAWALLRTARGWWSIRHRLRRPGRH